MFVGWRINAVAYPPLRSPKRSCCLIRSGNTWGQWEGVSFAIVAIRYNWLRHNNHKATMNQNLVGYKILGQLE